MSRIFNHALGTLKRRKLRRDMSDSENILWTHLRGRKMEAYRFRRQYGIGRYVVDFYCPKKRLALEVDGGHHGVGDVKEYDRLRDEFIEALGIRVIRFKNLEIRNNLNGVLEQIACALALPLPPLAGRSSVRRRSGKIALPPSLRRRGPGGG